jgi:8-oxo-dGTP pyrophosphatase MutT (NUDIX family)
LDTGKSYTRGDIFTITQVDEDIEKLSLLVEKTDYAHYLYCQNVDADLNGYGIRIIFTACLIETADNKILFGKMGEHTARSGIYQLAGGGIDKTDLVGDHFDLKGNITKEVFEEVGIDIRDADRVKDFSAAYLKQGGTTHKIAVIYRLRLLETAEDFLKQYDLFCTRIKENNELPEFSEIIVLNNTKKDIETFFVQHENECDEYMEPLFRYAYAF